MKEHICNRVSLTLAFCLILVTASLAAAQTTGSQFETAGCNDSWDTTFTSNGANNQVNAIVADGLGNYYIAGKFSSVQGVPAQGIAKWDDQTKSWRALGSGVNGQIYAIAINGNDVYVGGDFSMAGGSPARNVARWNGSTWSPLAAGLGQGTHIVRAITVHNGEIFIGGNFNIADGSPAEGIVRWNGSSFSSVGNLGGQVRSLASAGGFLYAGGLVAHIPGNSFGVIRWNGTEWASFGTSAQPSSLVNAIAVNGSDIYFVGSQIVIPGQQAAHVVRFNGTNWTRMAFFSNGILNAATVVNGEIHVGGYLPDPPNLFNNLAKWNGSNWVGLGSGIQGGGGISQTVMALANIEGTLYVGGNFTTAGGLGAKNIAKNDSGAWSAFSGTGIDGPARAIAVSGSDVYVGGSFTSAGPITANRIAKWNGVTNTWSALGVGINGSGTDNSFISAIAVAGGKVYAGGSFPRIGGVTASNIAVWNGTTWAPLGTGITGGNSRVSVIIVRGEDVYVAGDFANAGGVAANRIAKWNGTSWSGLNSAILPTAVTSMAFMGDDLYVGTGTTTAANPAYFSKYDGTNWTALGADLGDRGVSSIAVIGSDIYVGGGFITVNGVTVNKIVKWNGSSWSALGNGLPPASSMINGPNLAVAGNQLIASGDFTSATGGPGDRIARWNGTTWTTMSTGLNADANALLAAGGDIFAGGPFTTAGCNQSPYFARWRETVWNGTASTDWHTAANWGNNTVPDASAGVSIVSSDISISSADVTVDNLIVSNGRNVNIGASRNLTVTGDLDLGNGSIAGSGNLIVNGSLNLNGNISITGTITVNGDLYIGNGMITGATSVHLTSCRASSLAGGDGNSYITAPLTRCIAPTGTYRFPVGSGSVYAPIAVSNAVGTSTMTVQTNDGAHPGPGLPVGRLQRWWNISSDGITQADLLFNYLDGEVTGLEPAYRVFRVNGSAVALPSSVNTTANTAFAAGVTSFGAFTLAETPEGTISVGGRVRRPGGIGVPFVTVTLTDGNGGVWTTVTKYTGHYRFDNIPSPRLYTVTVAPRKRAIFAAPSQQRIGVTDNIADVNFVTSTP